MRGTKKCYLTKTEATEYFGASKSTVNRRWREIQDLIGTRYDAFAIIGNRVAAVVYADNEKYRDMLLNPNLRDLAPVFSVEEASKYLI